MISGCGRKVKDDKEDTVYVTIGGENEYAYQSYDCILYYNFYDQGGWILDDMEVVDFNVKDLSTKDNEEILATFNNDPDAYVTGTFDTINFTNVEDINFDTETLYSSKRIFFETRCDKTLKYTTKNTYELNELYNPQTGKWENEYSYPRIVEQSLDNMENIIWLGTPNKNGVYSYMQMRPVPEGIYYNSVLSLYLYKRVFTSENEEITNIMGELDADGYIVDGVLTEIDLINGTAQYCQNGREDDYHIAYFDFDAATIRIPDFNRTYSIYNTNGEQPPFVYKDFTSEEEKQLDSRRALDFGVH